jgi:3-phenylpropionate/trans-cinnamate dioxygenase ferredoxin subunit
MNNTTVFAANLNDVPPGKTRKVCFPDHSPILLANVDGTIYAVDDTCTHEDSSLALGCLRKDKVKCTLHGSWFSVVTGEPTAEPADEPLKTHEVELRNNEIWILLK